MRMRGDRFNASLSRISLSEIQKFFELAQKTANVISFGIGEPDFDTPQVIKTAACTAMEQGYTHYTPNMGYPDLRQAIADKMRQENDVDVGAENVMVTVGACQAVHSCLNAILNPGDEVVVFEPAFSVYSAVTLMAGADSVPCRLRQENGFHVDVEDLQNAITPATKAIILNTPHNPTGVVFTEEDLKCVAECADKHGLWVIADEIYDGIIYDGGKHISFASLPGMAERTITIGGFSKRFAMTGWRLGYVVAHEELLAQAVKVHQNCVACATSISQKAGVAALTSAQIDATRMVDEYAERRDLLYSGLKRIPGLVPVKPEGTFFMFVEVSGTGLSGMHLSTALLQKGSVVVVPGIGFGTGFDDYVRFSFALSKTKISEGLERIRKVIDEEGVGK